MKWKFALSSLLMAAICLPASAQQSDTIIIKFSHVAAADSPKGRATEYFKKFVEGRSNGKVRVELYPNSSLYKDKEELEALQMGAVQMLAPAPGKFGPMGVKEFEALELPYLFDGMEFARKVTQGAVGKKLLQALEPKGIKGLAFWDNGFRQFTSNVPLHVPGDLKRLKIRIQSSKTFEAMLRNVGALPQVMAFNEIYLGLQTGIIDGEDNPISNIYTQKFYEVQKHVTLTNHTYHGYVVVTNLKFWNRLPDNIRTIIEAGMRETSERYAAFVQEEDKVALEGIRKSGKTAIYTPTVDEMRQWRDEFRKVHKQMEGRLGKDLIQSIYTATDSKP